MQWAMKHKKDGDGFTIVELLIVVVIIAILAAITIVAYNGITQNARTSVVRSDLASAAKTLETFKVSSGSEQYPVTLDQAKLKNSAGVTFGYSANNATNPASFCLYADNGTLRYMLNSTNLSPREGSCTITNMVRNPNLSTNQNGWSTAGYGTNGTGTTTRTAGIGPTGGYAMRSEWTNAATSSGHSSTMNVPGAVTAGQVYTASVWVRSNQAVSTAMIRAEYGTVVGGGVAQVLQPNVWTRLSTTFTVTQNASSVNVSGRINDLAGTAAGLAFDVTQFMLTEGDTLFGYADGTSAGWAWLGTQNASVSSGPAL